jgi:hypothetical protein
MRAFAFLIMMSLVPTSLLAKETILPIDWKSHVYGIEVTENDLGQYVGLEKFEGDEFHLFKNQQGSTHCYYPVHAEKHYLGMVYCIER